MMLRDEEYAALCETVYDVKVAIYDVSDPEQKAALVEILDRAANGWYRVLAMDRNWTKTSDGEDTVKVYIEYAVMHKEVNTNQLPQDVTASSMPATEY